MIIFIYDGKNVADIQNHYPMSLRWKGWKTIKFPFGKDYITVGDRICRKGDPIIFTDNGGYFMDLNYLELYDNNY